MRGNRVGRVVVGGAVVLATVSACTSGSDGTPAPSATRTVTTTVTSPATTTTPTVASPALASPTGAVEPSGAPSSPAAAPTTPDPAGVALCTPAVTRTQVFDGAGAAEHFQMVLRLTDTSASPCVTTGYPGVALLDASGRQIEQATRTVRGYLSVTRGGVTTVVLQPGRSATAVVEGQLLDESVSPEGQCGRSPAFLVTLPDNTVTTRFVHTTSVCPSLLVHPFVAGLTDS